MPTRPSSVANHIRPTVVIWIFVTISFLGLLALYLSDFGQEPSGLNSPNQKGAYRFSIAARDLVVPAAWMQNGDRVENAALSNLQLAIPMTFNGEQASLSISLMPSSKAAPSAYLLDKLYIHNFDEADPKQQFGLVVKKLQDDGGFKDESVWYDALSASPFVAKCLEEKVGTETQINCISTMLVNKRVSALVQFDGKLLPYWRSLHGELAKLLPTFNDE